MLVLDDHDVMPVVTEVVDVVEAAFSLLPLIPIGFRSVNSSTVHFTASTSVAGSCPDLPQMFTAVAAQDNP